MPSFERDHPYLLALAKLRKPTKSYHLDYTFGSINEILSTNDEWNELDGPTPSHELIDSTPHSWYTQYWSNCAHLGISADLNG